MPLEINRKQVDEFILLLEEVQNSKDQEDKIVLLKALYDIDFNNLLSNNSSPTLVKALMEYGLKLITYFDDDLQQRSCDNLACDNAYKKMSSYKFYYKGLLNDLNLYKHFSYFYIPHYITSTGRIYSCTYFLQLQGHKITRAFINFKEQPQVNTADQIATINKIIIDHIPLINTDNMTNLNTIETFNNQIRGLMNQYLTSFCKDDVELKDYPFTSSLLDKLKWLDKSCKKSIDILYVKKLIEGVSENNYYHLIIKKDASGSGQQLVGYLKQDPSLAHNTNIIGRGYIDNYNRFLQNYLAIVDEQKRIVIQFYKEIFEESFEVANTIIKDNSLKYYLKTILTTTDDDNFNAIYDHIKQSSILSEIRVHFI